MNSTQFFISFAIIMMMLSLVSERLANFIKLYFQGKELYIPFIYREDGNWHYFLKVRLEILAYKQPTEMAEKEREYRVMIINVLIGIVIATLADANFFEIVKEIGSLKENSGLSVKGILINGFTGNLIIGAVYMFFFLWSISLILFSRLQELKDDFQKRKYKRPFIAWICFTIIILLIFKDKNLNSEYLRDVNFIAVIKNSLGFIITGIFLSLGSKFWHDLLDILFKFKNTQRVLSDPKTYKDYDSADKLILLVETSQYEIAERLYELYKSQISDLQGVVSHGLNTILDENTKLYKKIIEVEFINPEVQEKLERLKYSGSITLNFNVFYLKDYLVIIQTSNLIAISSMENPPVCYAFNDNQKNSFLASKGSFTVYQKGGKYYAKSNLHVFADASEFSRFEDNQKYDLKYRTVRFVIGNNSTHTGNIVDYKFGNHEGYGIDYCLCTVNKELFDLFLNQVDMERLVDIDLYTMRMFGATTKYVNFHSYRNLTSCKVEYSGFRQKKELYLFKIGTSSPGIQNINSGDSGSTIYYKIKTPDNNEQICTGILVAKSDNYAYMFIEY
ncbi:hypothetical protein [Chryseobacterium sp. EO14]|uniref:hypothetical protein n=1 Tax=Chryseobacterium sp. EO14 TaxID=2950551 RepID=UPI0021091755|nr:hypothetical protein [Chryseobacterium sp. EO14]MCQ4142563.1 hypothetical protein [Chryseobacterium sp. EO14]